MGINISQDKQILTRAFSTSQAQAPSPMVFLAHLVVNSCCARFFHPSCECFKHANGPLGCLDVTTSSTNMSVM